MNMPPSSEDKLGTRNAERDDNKVSIDNDNVICNFRRNSMFYTRENPVQAVGPSRKLFISSRSVGCARSFRGDLNTLRLTAIVRGLIIVLVSLRSMVMTELTLRYVGAHVLQPE